jgi:hypothetical protein
MKNSTHIILIEVTAPVFYRKLIFSITYCHPKPHNALFRFDRGPKPLYNLACTYYVFDKF